MPPGSSVERTPAGFTQTMILLSRYNTSTVTLLLNTIYCITYGVAGAMAFYVYFSGKCKEETGMTEMYPAYYEAFRCTAARAATTAASWEIDH